MMEQGKRKRRRRSWFPAAKEEKTVLEKHFLPPALSSPLPPTCLVERIETTYSTFGCMAVLWPHPPSQGEGEKRGERKHSSS